MKKISMLTVLLFALLFSACHGPAPYYPVDRVQSFIDLLNSQSAYDSYFTLVKHPNQTATEGFVVVYSADTGYVAYDIANYQVGDSWYTYSSYSQYQEVYIYDWYTDVYGEVFYVGGAYANDYWGTYAGEFVFEQKEESFKDLEKLGALKAAYKTAKLGESLASNFGLSEERAQKVAKLVVEWDRTAKSRSLTDADANSFSKELLGVNINDATAAYKKLTEGDSSDYNSLIDVAAETNGTSPEHMNAIINDFLK